MIDNPEFKGPWKPKMIDNPDYKGKWVHPKIPNPAYKYDEDMYKVCKDGCTHVGFELWQVKTGTLFDDILVTDSLEEAKAFAKETFEAKKDKEKEMYDKIQEEKKANEPEMPDYDDMDMGDMDMDMDVSCCFCGLSCLCCCSVSYVFRDVFFGRIWTWVCMVTSSKARAQRCGTLFTASVPTLQPTIPSQ